MSELPPHPQIPEASKPPETPPVCELPLTEEQSRLHTEGRLRTAACNTWEALLTYARSIRPDEAQTPLPNTLGHDSFQHITQMREELLTKNPDDVLNAALEAFDAYDSVQKYTAPLPFTRQDIHNMYPIVLQRSAERLLQTFRTAAMEGTTTSQMIEKTFTGITMLPKDVALRASMRQSLYDLAAISPIHVRDVFTTSPDGSEPAKLARFKTPDALRERLRVLDLDLPVDDKILRADEGSPMAQPLHIGERTIGNRWCIHPMEGWDGNPDGSPSEHTYRRWRRFGESGAKLIWGGEACAVQEDGRANPNQLMATAAHERYLSLLLRAAKHEHGTQCGTTDDLLVGLQLTHSGRFSRPHDKTLEPRIAYHHPLLDQKFGIAPDNDAVVWTDDDLEALVDRYVEAAYTAQNAGFDFVDVKACHGYLLHEFLSARTRPGKFGGDLDSRARLMLTIIDQIRERCPGLLIGVRLSVFDSVPYQASTETGKPMEHAHLQPYIYGFGVDQNNPLKIDLSEPIALMRMLQEHGVVAMNLSAGSPYYAPHIQRPAIFPPSDGYKPPEDPLVGVHRQMAVVRACKQALPSMPMIGTGYSYLQDFLPHVAQGAVRDGWTDSVGLGRMVLSYPALPADTLQRGTLERRKICRTFSDCTTAPRNGMISGCFPLDPYYEEMPEAERLKEIKRSA